MKPSKHPNIHILVNMLGFSGKELDVANRTATKCVTPETSLISKQFLEQFGWAKVGVTNHSSLLVVTRNATELDSAALYDKANAHNSIIDQLDDIYKKQIAASYPLPEQLVNIHEYIGHMLFNKKQLVTRENSDPEMLQFLDMFEIEYIGGGSSLGAWPPQKNLYAFCCVCYQQPEKSFTAHTTGAAATLVSDDTKRGLRSLVNYTLERIKCGKNLDTTQE